VQDPATILDQLGIPVHCAIDTQRLAILDAQHTSYVGHDVFLFSDTALKDRFDADPTRYCGIIRDPVSMVRFRPGKRSPRIEHAGKPFVFVSDSTLALFRAMPDSFAVPRYRMIEMMPAEM
jgi:hypothetical protein